MRAEADQRAAQHQAAVRVAVEKRGDVPRQPELIDFRALDEAGQLVRQDIAAHAATEAAALAAVAVDGGLEGARDRLRVVVTNAVEPLRVVEEALEDVRGTVRVLAKLKRAADQVEGGVTPSSGANALDERSGKLTLEDLAVSARYGTPIEEGPVRAEELAARVTRVDDADEAQARSSRTRVDEEFRRRAVAEWSKAPGLRIGSDTRGAFAAGSPHRLGSQQVGHVG